MASEQELYYVAYQLFRFAENCLHLCAFARTLEPADFAKVRRLASVKLSEVSLEEVLDRLSTPPGFSRALLRDHVAFKQSLSSVPFKPADLEAETILAFRHYLLDPVVDSFLRRISAFPFSRAAVDVLVAEGLHIGVHGETPAYARGYCTSFEPPKATVAKNLRGRQKQLTMIHELEHLYYYGPEPWKHSSDSHYPQVESALDCEATAALKRDPQLPVYANYAIRYWRWAKERPPQLKVRK